ncbi:MAG: hypothetical protein IKB40_00490 [Paludibacteraceae bacterium]|nr:hypothetical protein [Paludibacteraceae bacterium]
MKKLLLILSIFAVSLSAFAAELNPFAYNLKSEYNDKTQTLTINFTLNAPASYVKLAISDGVSDVWTKEYLASSYQAGKVPKATYTETIDALTLPQGKSLTWRVDVKGAAVASPTFVKNDVRLYAPTSVDIDNNPENANFGTVFCVEGLNGAYQTSGYTGYISYEDGAGLYLLNADGSARKMPFQTEKVRYGYNGGVVNQPNRTRPFFGNNGQYDLKGYNAYRVRVSDDGRIFVTAFSTNGHVLWEAKKECFSATTQEEWSANTGWHKVMAKGNANTFMATANRDCDNNHQYCGIFSLFQNNASTGTFIAGPNLGFDVRGSGDNLKLLMLSGCKQAVVYSTPAHFYCDEYDLGTATLWNTAPSRRIFAGHSNGVDIVNAQGVQVQYDKSDNVWVCQHRATTEGENTTLARVNRASSPTTDNINHNITGGNFENVEATTIYRRCGAIRFNEDFTQVAIASNAHGAGGGFTVYPVNASTGLPNWNSGTQVDTYTKTGNSLMDFAWDYAGNLYIAADAATNGERIAVYAMPHTADRVVSTPAASKYAFTVSCQAGAKYQVTTICNPPEAGTITCSIGGNARAAGVLNDIPSCTELTVTAIPEDGYKFLNWTDGNDNVLSTNKEFTFYVTENITLKANFEYATYTGIVWKNLFLNGEDIADKESDTYAGVNERLWRLFQVWWNNEFSASRNDQGTTSGKNEYDVTGFVTSANAVKMFTEPNRPFRWLGKYMMSVVGDTITNGTYWGIANINIWGYYLYAFINRTDKVYNSQNQAMGNDPKVHFEGFPNAGQPSRWRPYWAEEVCKLPMTMKYSDFMPTISTWKRDFQCPSGWNVPGVTPNVTPSDWYKWNVPANNPAVQDVDYQKYFILAWRANSPTGDTIVHHVYRNNMELHASYVLKNIDEEDRVDPTKYDASNDDVFELMWNRHWVNLDPDPAVVPTHSLTVTRKLQAGMYNTICLPFSVDLTGLADNNEYKHPLKDADAYEFAGTTTSTYNESGEPVTILNFNKVTQLQAGVPYLIKLKGNADVTEDLPFTGVVCDTILRPSVGGGLIFQPTINPTTVPAGSLILVANNRLAQTTEDGKMNGMRGYFMIDPTNPLLADDIAEQAADGRVYLSFQKPVTTSVPLAPEAEQPKKTKVRKVMYDGQIYILRGDEVYTITGHRVK